MFVGVLGSDRKEGHASRSQDGVGYSEARYHGVLADNSQLVGGAFLCLVFFGVEIRRCIPPKDKIETLATSIWTRDLCLGGRYRSHHAVSDSAFGRTSWHRCSVKRG